MANAGTDAPRHLQQCNLATLGFQQPRLHQGRRVTTFHMHRTHRVMEVSTTFVRTLPANAGHAWPSPCGRVAMHRRGNPTHGFARSGRQAATFSWSPGPLTGGYAPSRAPNGGIKHGISQNV